MKLKKMAVSVLALTAAMVLGGCSGQKSSSSNEKVEIQFMHSSVEQDRLDVINKLISKFEKENPDIKIKQVPVEEDAYNTKVVTLARSGKLPEVMEISQDFAKVMDKDELINRDSVKNVIDKFGKSNYYSGALNLVKTEDGKSYIAAPISGWVQGIWYDKEQFAQKGLKEPSTWDDIINAAKAFNDPANKKYGIAIPTAESTMSEQAFSQFALSNNANVLDKKGEITIDTKQMKEALNYYKELSSYTMPGSNDVTEIKDAFMNGSTPMAIYSTYILPAIFEVGNADKIGFAIPENKDKAVYGTVSGFTIAAGIKDEAKAKAAEKFVSFMSKPSNMTTWVLMSPGGAQPVTDKVVEQKAYQDNEVIKAFGDLMPEIAESFNEVQVFGLVGDKNFTKMGNITSSGAISKAVNGVTVGNENVSDALKQAQENAVKAGQ